MSVSLKTTLALAVSRRRTRSTNSLYRVIYIHECSSFRFMINIKEVQTQIPRYMYDYEYN